MICISFFPIYLHSICPRGSIQYANDKHISFKMHTQNLTLSRPTRSPLQLCWSVSLLAGCAKRLANLCGLPSATISLNRKMTYFTIFFANMDLSSAVTFVLGNDGSIRAASSHCFARGCWTTSFFSGSLSLSSSLRDAFPPMFCTSERVRRGPRCSSALLKPACTEASSLLMATNADWLLISHGLENFNAKRCKISCENTYPEVTGAALRQGLFPV